MSGQLVLGMQEFLESKGSIQNGARKDPSLSEFEVELAKYHATQSEILVGLNNPRISTSGKSQCRAWACAIMMF